MSKKPHIQDPRNYRIGIDVGTNSVGLAAIEVDEGGAPIAILSAVSHIHDSGVLEHKTATTRLAAAGVARRMRRLRRRRVKRLDALEQFFTEEGWTTGGESNDPYAAWRARARLSSDVINDEQERNALLVVALRHMARHRGWRNPYHRVSSMYAEAEPSEFFEKFRERVEERTGELFPKSATVAQLAIAAIDFDPNVPLRMGKSEKRREEREFSYLGGKLLQSDNANEIHAYGRAQRFDAEFTQRLIDLVFAADSPRGSHFSRVGKDPLDGGARAPKASDAFQNFRIASVLGNVRIVNGTETRPLTVFERDQAFRFLVTASHTSQPTWADVAQKLGFTRKQLGGTASLTNEGHERLPLRPPTHVTSRNLAEAGKKLRVIHDWWGEADGEARDSLVTLLLDGVRAETTPGGVAAWELLDSLDEEELAALDSANFPAGRAAYSLASLRALTEQILQSEEDLHEARKTVFGVDDSWTPPVEEINERTGNPAVDRVTRIVARWLYSAEATWGAPQSVTIEHVRDAFRSESDIRRREREMQDRFAANEKLRLELEQGELNGQRVTFGDVRRRQAITRQKGQCAYCGETITSTTAEMDHIVPRRGVGSTNTRTNLVAVCIPCNRSKSNIPFAVWAEQTNRPNVSVGEAVARTRYWTRDQGSSPKSWRIFLSEVRERLMRTESDPEIDSRSMESVAWMANELRERIRGYFEDARVGVWVYHGALTAGARQAAGIEGKIPFIGGGSKTRFDRRHHLVDAAVVALLNQSVAQTLAQRNSLRQAYFARVRSDQDWREFEGAPGRAAERFRLWRVHMNQLAELLNEGFGSDPIVVTQSVRLRLGSGKAHEDTITPFTRRRLGEAFSIDQIDAASTPALWTALTRCGDYDPIEGLPENPDRKIRVHGILLDSDDEVELFDKPRAALAVRGGWAMLGDSIHHTRIYRWEVRGRAKYGMLRVFAADLQRHRNEDLFNVEPRPAWISMRAAEKSVGKADLNDFEYLGWLVKGDEVEIDLLSNPKSIPTRLSELLKVPITTWVIEGFESPSKLNLKPRYLSGEGLDRFLESSNLDEDDQKFIRTLLTRSWRVSVGVLFGNHHPRVIRRDALGRPRYTSSAGLPTCWPRE